MPLSHYTHGDRDQLPNDHKLAELIIYIAQRCEGDEKFGATKLNKLLFFSDFAFYAAYGRSITGQEYQALPQGPAPRRIMPIQRTLTEQAAAVVIEREYYGRKQTKTIALRDPDLSLFSAEEISVVDRVIQHFWNMSATVMSDLSHEFDGWKLALVQETIPYSVALIYRRQPTPDEIAYARELEASLPN